MIIGYDDIHNNVQKPHPFGGIKCLKQLFKNINDKTVLYIGDHEGDVEFARNIEKELNGKSRLLAVAAKYSGAEPNSWNYKPDFELENPRDLLYLLEKLA